MGIPWNPEWDAHIARMVDQRAANLVEQRLADGSTLSLMTPGSIPSAATTNAAESVVVGTDAAAAHVTLSATIGSWQIPSSPVSVTLRHGGRPIVVMALGSIFPISDEARLSFAVNGDEVTNTPLGLQAHRPNGGAWEPVAIAALHRPRAAGTTRFDLVSYRAAAVADIYLLTYTGRFTLMAWEV